MAALGSLHGASGLSGRAMSHRSTPVTTLCSSSGSSASSPFTQPWSRRGVVVQANFDSFKNMFSGKDKSSKEEAARKAIQDSFAPKFGKGKAAGKGQQQPPQTQQSGGGGGGFAGFFGGGGGKGGFGGFSSAGDDGDEQSLFREVWGVVKGTWIFVWNALAFLAVVDVMHRSLDWCCQIELLLLVGAPQQAFEKVAAVFLNAVEWVEKNFLGWDVPEDESTIPAYMNIKTWYPEEHAYTFESYKHKMTDDEVRKLKHFYALRHFERKGGQPGDVDPADVQAIKDKYDPDGADRRAYQRAVAEGRVEDYWQARKREYERIVGQPFERPGARPAPTAAAAGAGSSA